MSDLSDVVWYIARDDRQFGPFSAEDFSRFEREGQLVPADRVWYTGLDEWISYGDYRSRQRPPGRAVGLLLRRALRFPLDLVTNIFAIVRRPTQFGRSRIDTGPRDLGRAVYFYINIFVLVFVTGSSLTYLDFYAGVSQPRELAWLTIQIVLAVPLLYFLNVIARQRVRFSGVAQGVLYADALFLIPLTLVGFLLSYLMFSRSPGQHEIDILATVYEQCLAEESFLYWLLRGDLRFFVDLPKARGGEHLELVKDYFQYALAVPFCVLFAKLLHGRYAAPVLLNTVLGVVVFLLVVPGFLYGRQQIEAALVRNSACDTDHVALRASQKYNPSLLARQIVARTNAQLSRTSGTYGTWMSLAEGRLAMAVQVRPGIEDVRGAAAAIARGARSLYCESNSNLQYARSLGMALLLTVRDDAERIIFREKIDPSACPSGPTAR